MCDADKEIRSVLNEEQQVKERAMKIIFYQIFRHNSIKGKNGTRVSDLSTAPCNSVFSALLSIKLN